MLQISETGNAGELLAAQQSPEQHHQAAISDRHVGRGECSPKLLIVAQLHEGRRCRHDEVTAHLLEMRDGGTDRAVEERDAEDLLEMSRRRAHDGNVQRPTSNVQRRGSNLSSEARALTSDFRFLTSDFLFPRQSRC